MGSFAVHRTLKTTGRILMLAACAVPGAGFAQGAFEPEFAASDEQRQLVERIREEQSRDGARSPELIGPLAALGLLYQESGDHGLAVAATERARLIVRVNYGLYSLEEAPLLRQLIYNEEARGNAEQAWALEQKLLTLARRHTDDLRTARIFREIADKRMDVLRRYLGGEFPPQIVLGCYYGGRRYDGTGSCRAGSRSRVKASLVNEAQSYYSQAISTILRNEGYSSDELPELLMKLIRTSYEYGRPALGKKSLRYLFSYRVANSEPPLAQVNALVQIADWDLLFARDRRTSESALEAYEQAYEQLAEAGMEQASVDEIFAPTVPVVLPAFLPNPLVSEETPSTTGYIDVAFDVTRYGESEEVEILDTTMNAAEAAKSQLVDLIESSRFRPMIADGRFADTSRAKIRYYLND